MASLFGKLHNHEETNILRMEIMQDTYKDISIVLYSKKSPQNSNNDIFDETDGEAMIVNCYISINDK